MRADKFLKVSRLIKRRSVANDACGSGRVSVNGRDAKPSTQIKEGDVVSIGFGVKKVTFRVKKVLEHVRAEEAETMYEIIEDEK